MQPTTASECSLHGGACPLPRTEEVAWDRVSNVGGKQDRKYMGPFGPADDSFLCFSRARDGGTHAARIPTPHPHQRTGQLCLFCHCRHGGR